MQKKKFFRLKKNRIFWLKLHIFPRFSSILPSYWTKWVDRPGVRAKWTIFFQSPKGTRFTNKAQIKKYFEKFQISYSSELFDFELDENVTKLHKIWKKFIFKNKSDSTSTAVSKNLQEIVKSLALCTIFTILLTFLVMHIWSMLQVCIISYMVSGPNFESSICNSWHLDISF